MTEFKIGYAYVNDATGNVYIYDIHDWSPHNQIGVFVCKQKCKDSLYLIDGELKTFYNDTDFLIKCRTILRSWQASDEPTSYAPQRWGGIEIGKVYRCQEGDYCIPYATSRGMVLSLFGRGGRWLTDSIYLYKINDVITRPAFPHEMEGIKLPQLSGVIR